QGRNEMGSPAFLVQSGCGLEESSREPRTPLRSLRVGLLGMWGFLRGIGLVIRRQEFSPAHITITVESAKVGAPCPSCGRVSRSRCQWPREEGLFRSRSFLRFGHETSPQQCTHTLGWLSARVRSM